MSTAYIGRLAPSPTGLLHLGHAATFWQAFLRAREHNGTLLFRNEDLDPHRSRAEFVSAMFEDLAWLGIHWTPPIITQSQRLPLYRAALEQLLTAGHIYPCRCSRRDLARMTQAPHEDAAAPGPDDGPVYPGTCRPAQQPATSFQPNTSYRLRVTDGETILFSDRNLGLQSFVAGSGRDCSSRLRRLSRLAKTPWQRSGRHRPPQLSTRLRRRRRGHGDHRSSARPRST